MEQKISRPAKAESGPHYCSPLRWRYENFTVPSAAQRRWIILPDWKTHSPVYQVDSIFKIYWNRRFIREPWHILLDPFVPAPPLGRGLGASDVNTPTPSHSLLCGRGSGMTEEQLLSSAFPLDCRLIKHAAQIKQSEVRGFTTEMWLNRSRLSRLRQPRRFRSRLVIPSSTLPRYYRAESPRPHRWGSIKCFASRSVSPRRPRPFPGSECIVWSASTLCSTIA